MSADGRAEAAALLAFFRAAAPLKDTLRSGRTACGRQESTAEHSWRLCLMALTLREAMPQIDTARLLGMLVIHDLGEATTGDIPAPLQTFAKGEDERAALSAMLAPLPPATARRLLALWEEYEAGATPEARAAKALDKIETCLGHVEGAQPPDFDYAFNLGYGRAWDGIHPMLDALRAMVDAETARRAAGGD